MGDYAWWAGLLAWLADRAPPLVAGFLGGIVGSVMLERYRRRRKQKEDACR